MLTSFGFSSWIWGIFYRLLLKQWVIFLQYRRFIVGPTLNHSKKRSRFFLEIITQCCWNVLKKIGIFLEIITWCCWKCSKSQNFIYFLLLAECKLSTLINYSTNMCRTSYEPTVVLNINRLFLKLNQFVCNEWAVLPDHCVRCQSKTEQILVLQYQLGAMDGRTDS